MTYYILKTDKAIEYYDSAINPGKKIAKVHYNGPENAAKRFKKGDKLILFKKGKGIFAIAECTGFFDKIRKGHEVIYDEFMIQFENFTELEYPMEENYILSVLKDELTFNSNLYSLFPEKVKNVWNEIQKNFI